MSTETKFFKDRDGWQGQTYIDLPDVKAHGAREGREGVTRLSIRTGKSGRGGLATFASVAFHGADGFTTHAMGMGTGLGDFSRTVLRSGERCTEKHIQILHDEALKLLPDVLTAVRAHYAAQEAKRAAEKAAA